MATEVTTVNTPATSKINWVAGIAFVAGIAAMFGIDISQETQDLVAKFIALGLPPIIMFFRTFMTSKKLYGG
jgi:carbon monoxide dehydrogenase subunit G